MEKERVILAIDPGNYKTGYSIFIKEGNNPRLLASGCINLPKKRPQNLKYLFNKLSEIINQFNPQEIALESSFYGKNPQTLIRLGEIRGIILLLSSLNNIPIFEYTPQQVKNALTGYGWAKKEDILAMVNRFFNVLPDTYDEADAIAIGFCHCINSA
jgi:crossover junction endodeoxyribonuclease RuvC